MSDRIIRDELLRSHRFVHLSSDTLRLLFVGLLLSADDLGNTEATSTAIGIIMVRACAEETCAKWLNELADVDLVRIYVEHDKRYAHIPRFRQRLRYTNGKNPRPPSNIECSEIRELADKVRPKSVYGQSQVSPKSVEVKRSEENKSTVRSATAPPGFLEFWSLWPSNARKVNRKGALGCWIRDSMEESKAVIIAHVTAMKSTDQWREFCPMPVTYLNQHRWEDGVIVAKPRDYV